jgi:hypothetical protein
VRERARVQRFRASGHLFPFFRRIQKENESVRFAHFQFACIIKRIHRSPKEGSRERERVRVRFSPHKRESRASDLRSKKEKLSEKKRNSRLLERALKERKSFHFCPSLLSSSSEKKEGSSQRSKKKKKREISREKTPKGGKALAF